MCLSKAAADAKAARCLRLCIPCNEQLIRFEPFLCILAHVGLVELEARKLRRGCWATSKSTHNARRARTTADSIAIAAHPISDTFLPLPSPRCHAASSAWNSAADVTAPCDWPIFFRAAGLASPTVGSGVQVEDPNLEGGENRRFSRTAGSSKHRKHGQQTRQCYL